MPAPRETAEPGMTGPRFLDAGELALTVEFGAEISDEAAAKVMALDIALRANPLPGMTETVPTYRSLMIHYDPLVLTRADLVAHVGRALHAPRAAQDTGRHWCLPACYDPSVAPDLPHVATATGLAEAEVVRRHAGTTFQVVMCGFAPGWAYLSNLPPALTLPRRESPRDRIPEGSLIIAGGQAIVAALAMPSGWHIVGRTPERLFVPARDPAVLLAPGDRVSFDPVDAATFAALDARATAGEPLARLLTA
jgi:KipI family sensor histidine kinase inhibitor